MNRYEKQQEKKKKVLEKIIEQSQLVPWQIYHAQEDQQSFLQMQKHFIDQEMLENSKMKSC